MAAGAGTAGTGSVTSPAVVPVGGTGGNGASYGGGGGGGGYHSGGGAGGITGGFSTFAPGGGGGAGYAAPGVTGVSGSAGAHGGNGSITLTYSIPTVPQTITFTSTAPVNPAFGSSYSVTATGGGGTKPVTLGIDPATTNSACTIGGSVVTFHHAGSCVVAANQAASVGYTAATTATQTIVVPKAAQAISFSLPSSGSRTTSLTLSSTGGGSGNPVIFSVDPTTTNSACSITGATTLHLDHAGACVVDADQAGSSDYAPAAQVQHAIAVSKSSQAISFSLPSSGSVGGTQPLSATGGGSGNGVTFSVDGSTSNSACSITGGTTLHLDHVGSCVVDADQAGDSDYAAAPQAQQTLTVGKASQAITFTLPGSGTKNGTQPLSATGGGSGNAVTFSVDATTTNNACSITGGTTLHLDHAGSCVVDADQAGDSDYTAAPQAQQTLTVGKASQAISFSLPSSGNKGGTQRCPPPAAAPATR